MDINEIEQFFNHYLGALKRYDLAALLSCYHLPCTLNTPDNAVLLSDTNTAQQAFNEIFSQLQDAKTSDIKVLKSSFAVVDKKICLVCVDWEFIDEQGNVFTDFCAIYHLLKIENELKIINTNSHELANSLSLAMPFAINSEEQKTIKEIKT